MSPGLYPLLGVFHHTESGQAHIPWLLNCLSWGKYYLLPMIELVIGAPPGPFLEGLQHGTLAVIPEVAGSDNPPSSTKRALETLAQPNIHGWLLVSFISQAQRTNSFPLCSILTLFCLFVPILGQREGSCALAFVGFNEAGFDSISYQVSSFVCMGRRAEKCSFKWCQKRRQRKTRKKSDNCFFSIQVPALF